MHVLVVFAHPDHRSFCGRLLGTATGALTGAGHTVDLLDLHAEGFDPVLAEHEWADRLRGGRAPELAAHDARLRRAYALVLVHPTWWGGQPAILKGWLDRTWPLPSSPGLRRWFPVLPSRRPLGNLRRVVVVTTHGSPRRVNRLQGEPGRLVARRGLRGVVHPLARTRFLACYGLDGDDPGGREAFVARVARELGRL